MLEDNTILSTNFVPIFPKLDNSEISLLTLSWLVSVFGQVQFEEVEELSDTDRGSGGFGSTGA